jgi:tungstate transport system permease protein
VEALGSATREALLLLFTGDAELWEIVWISCSVSGRAMLLATPPAVLLAFALAYGSFPGRRLLITTFHTLLAVPTVVIGLLLFMLISRSGPLGELRLLFTQSAMVAAQVLIALPILVAMTHSALQSADRRAWETAVTLGASPLSGMVAVMYEVRFAVYAAILAAFSRIIAEVGASLLVGGNILGQTRNITTAIALESQKGMYAQGIALGMVLLVLALALNAGLIVFQGKGRMQ